jgi:hypothetical protein
MKKIDFKNTNQANTKDFDIPSVGIEDVDRAIFDLFNSDLFFNVTENSEFRKVPVVFASGERFALTRRTNPIRDKNNTLILPLISIERGDIDFSAGQGNRGTPIAPRDQPSYVVKKRLSKSDRQYQNIVNKFALKNQDNVTSRKHFVEKQIAPGNIARLNTNTTRRQKNGISFSGAGGKINLDSQSSLGDNIFEIIQVPYPIFILINYNVTFWTQYMSQMNQMQEILLSSFKGQTEEFLLKTQKGYEFVAAVNTTFSSDTNFSDYTESERIIKTSFDIATSGYIINPKHPSIEGLVRSSFSAPTIEFGYFTSPCQITSKDKLSDDSENKFILGDIDSIDDKNNKIDRGQSSAAALTEIINPFTNEITKNYSRVLTSNQRAGETVASCLVIKKIETQYE